VAPLLLARPVYLSDKTVGQVCVTVNENDSELWSGEDCNGGQGLSLPKIAAESVQAREVRPTCSDDLSPTLPQSVVDKNAW